MTDFHGVGPLEFENLKPAAVPDEAPEILSIDPECLVIEESYQRDLTAKSYQLIRKIVETWDWMHFKPPIVAETDQYYLVIDGQHTAIAAATHPDIAEIPVMVLRGREAQARARAFVAQNRDRIALSALQIFHAEFVSGDKEAVRLLKLVLEHGGEIPRSPPARGAEKPGQFFCIAELKTTMRLYGDAVLGRIVRICVASGMRKIPRIAVRALKIIFAEPYFSDAAKLPDAVLAHALRAVGDLDAEAQAHAVATDQPKDRAAASLLAERACRRRSAA